MELVTLAIALLVSIGLGLVATRLLLEGLFMVMLRSAARMQPE